MIAKRFFAPSSDGYEVPLDAYVPVASDEIDPAPRRRAVVVFPGGGYRFLSDREAEPVALALAAAGLNAFVARYRVAPARFPAPVQDAAAAVAYVRAHAEELYTDPEHIAVLGFSAGGHLAGALGTRWHIAEYWRALGLSPEEARPNAMALCYPVVTGGAFAHRGSFESLTGVQDIAEHARYSLEDWVTPECPPTFLWHTFEDGSVPVQNSLLMAKALADARVPLELHVFPQGGHGMALCDERTSGTRGAHHNNAYNAQWLDLAIHFLKTC